MSPVLPQEAHLLAAVLALMALAVFGPPLAQADHYHDFADQQLRWGLAHAADVLSNLPFALLAGAGAWRLPRAGAALSPAQRAMAWVTCAGLLLTAIGSAAYHLRPDDAGLVLDRAASLKHLAAAVAILPVLAGWRPADGRVQNARQLPIRAA